MLNFGSGGWKLDSTHNNHIGHEIQLSGWRSGDWDCRTACLRSNNDSASWGALHSPKKPFSERIRGDGIANSKTESPLLWETRYLAGSRVFDAFLANIFLRPLPSNVVSILTVVGTEHLTKAAAITDQIVDATRPQIVATTACTPLSPTSGTSAEVVTTDRGR